jgi:hypothetical protein
LQYVDFFLFAPWRRLASYKVTYARGIDTSQQYILAEFPHGVCTCHSHQPSFYVPGQSYILPT